MKYTHTHYKNTENRHTQTQKNKTDTQKNKIDTQTHREINQTSPVSSCGHKIHMTFFQYIEDYNDMQ